VIERESKDVPTGDNPVTAVRHTSYYGTDRCLGLRVHLWCPGCQELHAPTFRCPEHGGPADGPVWDGDPYSEPFSMEPSLLVDSGRDTCHSFIRNGQWQFLTDCVHALAGQTVPLEPLPDWLAPQDPA
jgi:hypothetical protein